MTSIQLGLIILLGLYFVVGVGTYFLVQRSGRRFIIAGKRLPFFVIGTMLFAQALDANSTMGAATGAYTVNFWFGFSFPLGLAICLVVTGLWFAKPLNRMNMITLADFYYRRYNKPVEVIVSLLMAFSFIILVAGNMAGAAWIMTYIFEIPYITALAIMSVLVLAYTFSGGLFSCAATDMVQEYPAIIAFSVGAVWLVVAAGGWDSFAAAIPPGFFDWTGLTSTANLSLVTWANLLALGLGDIVALDFMERVFAAKDPETAQKGCYYGAAFTLIAGLAATSIGLMAFKLLPAADIVDPRTILPMVAVTSLPLLLGLFVLVGPLAAGLSTANGGGLAISAVFSRNIFHRNILQPYLARKARVTGKPIKKEDWHVWDQRLLWWARFVLIPVFAVAGWLAYVKPEPGIMLVLAFDVVFAGCLVPLVLGIYWKKANAWGALSAVIVGSILRLILYIKIPPDLAGLDTMIPPVVSLVVMVVVCLLTQKQDPPKHKVISEVPSDEDVARAIR
ncbi:MAG: hypothetical protein FJ023_00505 [Chloroflexi bacterium]|nr:hypothetical protein [Chloroflexota bacterium]